MGRAGGVAALDVAAEEALEGVRVDVREAREDELGLRRAHCCMFTVRVWDSPPFTVMVRDFVP